MRCFETTAAFGCHGRHSIRWPQLDKCQCKSAENGDESLRLFFHVVIVIHSVTCLFSLQLCFALTLCSAFWVSACFNFPEPFNFPFVLSSPMFTEPCRFFPPVA